MALTNLVWCIVLLGSAFAYDTGHHNDLTRNTLQVFGYNENAQKLAGVANFFVDYFAFTPLSSEMLPELNSMHFDNVFTLQNASNYWAQFTINSRRAIQQAATNGDPVEFIMTLGGTLHSVQDFYTHSSWVDLHYRTECDCYRSDTWINTMHSANGDINTLVNGVSSIHTYSYGECDKFSRNCFAGQIPHGDACGGINKDSYVRPYWEQSYGFAFSASTEWVENMHQWAAQIDPTIIDKAKTYTPSSSDQSDLNDLDEYLHVVSYAIKFRGEDGHWKGPGSGSLKRFLPATASFTASKSLYKSKYQDSKIHLRWATPNPYDAPDISGSFDITTIPSITTPYTGASQFTPVVLRTAAVRGNDKLNTPSYFAVVNIDGLEFVETVQIDKYNFNPHWTSIKFVNATSGSVPIQYTLKDNKYPRSDDIVSVVPSGAATMALSFDIASHQLTGDVSGVYDNYLNYFNTSNSNQGVTVGIFVTANKYATCTTGIPAQYCPNEAYVMAGVFDECHDGRETVTSSASLLCVSSLFSAVLLGLVLVGF